MVSWFGPRLWSGELLGFRGFAHLDMFLSVICHLPFAIAYRPLAIRSGTEPLRHHQPAPPLASGPRRGSFWPFRHWDFPWPDQFVQQPLLLLKGHENLRRG